MLCNQNFIGYSRNVTIVNHLTLAFFSPPQWGKWGAELYCHSAWVLAAILVTKFWPCPWRPWLKTISKQSDIRNAVAQTEWCGSFRTIECTQKKRSKKIKQLPAVLSTDVHVLLPRALQKGGDITGWPFQARRPRATQPLLAVRLLWKSVSSCVCVANSG